MEKYYNKAFVVHYFDMLKDNTISLKGRVCNNISINDQLYKIDTLYFAYKVIKIIAYNNNFDTIHEGMTCELILEGENQNFNDGEILFLKVNKD
jgi:hypothetical protein